jgi:hypothetical protein
MMHDRSDPAKLRYEMLPHELTVVFFEMGHPHDTLVTKGVSGQVVGQLEAV